MVHKFNSKREEKSFWDKFYKSKKLHLESKGFPPKSDSHRDICDADLEWKNTLAKKKGFSSHRQYLIDLAKKRLDEMRNRKCKSKVL